MREYAVSLPAACVASALLRGASVAPGAAAAGAGGGTAGKGPQKGKMPGGKPGNMPGATGVEREQKRSLKKVQNIYQWPLLNIIKHSLRRGQYYQQD